jgi:hypothetical protein
MSRLIQIRATLNAKRMVVEHTEMLFVLCVWRRNWLVGQSCTSIREIIKLRCLRNTIRLNRHWLDLRIFLVQTFQSMSIGLECQLQVVVNI